MARSSRLTKDAKRAQAKADASRRSPNPRDAVIDQKIADRVKREALREINKELKQSERGKERANFVQRRRKALGLD